MADPQTSQPPATLPANFSGFDQQPAAKAPPATLPADFNQWDAPRSFNDPMTKKVGYYINGDGNTVIAPKEGEEYSDTIQRAVEHWKSLSPDQQSAELNRETARMPEKVAGTLYGAGKIGATAAGTPLLLTLSIPELIGGIIGGGLGGYGGGKLAKAVGAGDFGQEIASDVGSLVGGSLGAKSSDFLTSKARGVFNALPEDLQDQVRSLAKKGTGLVSPRLKNAIDFWDSIKGLKTRLSSPGAPEELDATAENKPYAGEPAPKAASWNAHDATGENKPFAGGMDEYAAPRNVAPASPAAPSNPAVAENPFKRPQSAPAPAASKPAPQPVSGEGALRNYLNSQDSTGLRDMANERGLKLPSSTPKPQLINHIIDDFSDEELDDFRSHSAYGGIEGTPMKMPTKPAAPVPMGGDQLLNDLLESLKPENLAKLRARKAQVQ